MADNKRNNFRERERIKLTVEMIEAQTVRENELERI
jgi:hypothetical protein